jgi:putative ABC transport system ATP-binding protein
VKEAKVQTGPLIDLADNTRDSCAVIALHHVTREYVGHGGVVRALADASFSIVAGEWVAITGPSGSGKSTLVNLIGCLDRPTAGELKIDNVDVASMSATELDRFRADKIGFIFQQFHLIPYLSRRFCWRMSLRGIWMRQIRRSWRSCCRICIATGTRL